MMKKLLFILLFIHSFSFAQEVTGNWSGEIQISGMSLEFGMKITKESNVYQSVMDIPAQKAMGIQLTSTTFEDNTLVIESKEMKAVFNGKLSGDVVSGTFSQMGMEMPFSMKKGEFTKKENTRTQVPQPPFNYEIKEVSFENKFEKVSLAGTLTIPKGKGPFPAVVLISGSGQQNRDSEILDHKPFWVIADYLSSRGIAVLRYDDRGAGKSTGNPESATSENFAKDAEAAVAHLRSTAGIDKKRIGIIGHSEGGMIAPMVAVDKENKIDFLVLLAGPAVSGAEILEEQQALISRAAGESEKNINENRKMTQAITAYIEEHHGEVDIQDGMFTYLKEYILENELELPKNYSVDQLAGLLAKLYSSAWMQYFLLFDPEHNLSQLQCPILALNGSKDLQVPAELNINKMKQIALKSGNDKFETNIFPDLNHLFQNCETGSPSEYAEISETFSVEVLDYIEKWIHNLK